MNDDNLDRLPAAVLAQMVRELRATLHRAEVPTAERVKAAAGAAVAAGALIGTAAALLVWQPPIRSRVDWLADEVGAQYERLVGRLLGSPAGASSR